jgi:flavin reductase (DIM6/NTAB) family NADH-FMN oxidoreductase RutF
MDIDPSSLDRRSSYRLMISAIAPRPIAWVTSMSREGVVNLAPFSYFNGVSSHPPVVSIAVGSRKEGRKDTWINIEETREFVVHVVVKAEAERMVLTSKELPHNVSEVEMAKLTPVPSAKVKVPRIAESPVAMECRLHQIVEIEGTALILGRVIHWHLDDAVLTNGLVDPAKATFVGRLGGDGYTLVERVFEVPRPT